MRTFFVRDGKFYKKFFIMMMLLTMQNILTYTVNVADNIMLGAYSQTALSAAAAVNQIQYILQQFTVMGLGEGIVILSGQYWGKQDRQKMQQIAGVGLTMGAVTGLILVVLASVMPERMIELFTGDEEIIRAGVTYLRIIRFTYLFFILNNLLLAMLRSMQVVRIAFFVSLAALGINVSINYMLIFGHFGAPRMGITGAAIGTLIATLTETLILLFYLAKSKVMPFRLQIGQMLHYNRTILWDYLRVAASCVASAIIFSSAVAIQTAIFGHLNSDALAASSVAGTFFQYTKMIPTGAAGASGVLIAQAVGSGKTRELRPMVHSLQAIFLGVGCFACVLLLVIRNPVVSFYDLTDRSRAYALMQLFIQAFVSIAMGYQMPCQIGIIRPGGDARYSMISDFIYSWVVVIPLGLLAAFVFHWPFAAVVFCLNIDQFLKVVTVGYKTNSFTWAHVLVKSGDQG